MSPCEKVVQVSSVPRGAAAGSEWRFHYFLLQRWGIPPLLLKMAAAYKLRVVGAAQVVVVCAKGETVLAGSRMKDIVVYQVSSTDLRAVCVCVVCV